MIMLVDRSRTIEWDGRSLTGWIVHNEIPTKFTADRQAIHKHASGFSDALTWEISRFRSEIFEKLLPFFRAAASAQTTNDSNS